MSISLLLEMATSSDPDRTAIVSGDVRLTTQQLSDLADGGAGIIARSGASHVAYVGLGGAMLPLLMFASVRAGVPFTPINYRLSAEGITTLIARLPDPLVVVDSRYLDGLDALAGATRVIVSDDFLVQVLEEALMGTLPAEAALLDAPERHRRRGGPPRDARPARGGSSRSARTAASSKNLAAKSAITGSISTK